MSNFKSAQRRPAIEYCLQATLRRFGSVTQLARVSLRKAACTQLVENTANR